MATFAEKVKQARAELGITREELGEAAGVSARTIFDYERGRKSPRQSNLLRLAKALRVSSRFLSDESCDDPLEGIEKDGYITEARNRYGAKGTREVDALLNETLAFMAGGDTPQEDKDKFFEALMSAYVMSKETAKKQYGRKKEK